MRDVMCTMLTADEDHCANDLVMELAWLFVVKANPYARNQMHCN
jgi:hypothetical protein